MVNQIQQGSIDAVVFDCDGTLSALEGIIELANHSNQAQEVIRITTEVMQHGGLCQELFAKRLNLIKPSLEQLKGLSEQYYLHRTKNIECLIQSLQAKGITVYVFSAGIEQAVLPFAKKLGILPEHVYAVKLNFNEHGDYQSYDTNSELVHDQGKVKLIQRVFTASDNIIFIGDGANDVVVQPYVTKFIGYGAHYYRQNIEQLSDAYIRNLDALSLESIIFHQ